MIVFVNVEKQVIECYSKEGGIDIPFVDAMKLFSVVGDSKICYVTNATETKAEEVIRLVQSMGVRLNQVSASATSNKKYIHVVGGETVMVGSRLKLEGKYDIRPFDKEMAQFIKSDPTLQALIKNGKVEIIGEIKKEALLKELKGIMAKKDALQRKKDAALDAMILNKSVDDFDGMSEDGSTDVISIDMTSELVGKRTIGEGVRVGGIPQQPSSMEDLMREIDMLERGER